MRDQEELYDRLLECCYATVLNPNAWHELLAGVADATGRQQGALLFWDPHNPTGEISKTYQLDKSVTDAYNSYYCNLDPARSIIENWGVGHWYHDELVLGVERMRRDPFYQEFKRPFGLRSVSSTKLYETNNARFFFSLLLTIDAPQPSLLQQSLLKRITPHLVNAANLSSRITQLELHVAKRDLLLEKQSVALWLLEADGRVIHCNMLAERAMLLADHLLYQDKGRLLCRFQNGLLQQALHRAGGNHGPRRASLLHFTTPVRRDLLVTPVAADSPFNSPFQRPLVMLAVLENRIREELLADLFQASPAELRLAVLLAQGYNPEQCALQLGISINTVRSQLRSLYRKTGTERQGELLSLIGHLSV